LSETRQALLQEVLRAAPFDGWSGLALDRAAETLGFERHVAREAFPGGVKEVLAFFMAEADREMAAGAKARGLDQGPVRQRVGNILRLRLEALAPHREAIRRALALHLLPGKAPSAIGGIYRTVDAIWRAAGDGSTDFNFYTKRAILAAVYSATLLRWLDDQSEDCAETWAFMERRLAGTARIGKARRQAEKVIKCLPSPLPALTRLRYGARAIPIQCESQSDPK
jgi:ubiquinone biosynthesis protein COQ9